ncbi:hypothetical protein QAD02_012495 [Eretmocerus hayati]|uniref:Uncharacterized protein n=1 Tax=Eretmocerus hayati TaxID=131215 RepID=A0ACC2P0Q7_9HYME|nr:hypothetical protein QAD02_012495 [Eretmocerus hayati]
MADRESIDDQLSHLEEHRRELLARREAVQQNLVANPKSDSDGEMSDAHRRDDSRKIRSRSCSCSSSGDSDSQNGQNPNEPESEDDSCFSSSSSSDDVADEPRK